MKNYLKRKVGILLALVMVANLWNGVLFENVQAETNVTATNSYTVYKDATTNWTMTNQTATDGPVILTYTVATISDSSDTAPGNNGVISTTKPTEVYPYDYGSMKFHNTQNQLLVVGYTYHLTLQNDADGVITYSGSCVAADGTEKTVSLSNPVGSGNTSAEYFGIYVAGTVTAMLTNVSITDEDGNDLGIQTSHEASTITDNRAGYTVVKNAGKWGLTNQTTTNGPVTLQYTVAQVSSTEVTDVSNNGVIATMTPSAMYSYDDGSFKFHHASNEFFKQGYTYTITIHTDTDGYVTYTGTRTDEAGTVSTMSFSQHVKNETGCQYFGLYIYGSVTAVLTNVSCVNVNGDDLGLQTNQSSSWITKNVDTNEAKSYTIRKEAVNNWAFTNEVATSGPVTLRYTVAEAEGTYGNNGVITTMYPLGTYPYSGTYGHMQYYNTENELLKAGYTYELVLNRDADGKVTYTGERTDADGTKETVSLAHSAGDGNTNAQYFGIYISGNMTATLVNVTMVDVAGNDLGVQVNQTTSGITENRTGYTVIKNTTNSFAMMNKTESGGPVTLTYTVAAISDDTASGVKNNGVIATTNPQQQHPYDNGSMSFHHASNQFLKAGCTYTITMSLDDNKCISWSGSYVDANGTSGTITVSQTTTPAGVGAYFGLYFSGTATAVFTNVICMDEAGNDLGIQTNLSEYYVVANAMEEEVDLSGYTLLTLWDYGIEDGSVTGGEYLVAETDEVPPFDNVLFQMTFENAGQLSYGGWYDESDSVPDRTWHGVRVVATDSSIVVNDNFLYDSGETSPGTETLQSCSVTYPFTLGMRFDYTGDNEEDLQITYYLDGNKCTQATYPGRVAQIGEYLVLHDGIAWESVGERESVLTSLYYDLDREGSYLLTGDYAEILKDGEVYELADGVCTLTEPGVYTLTKTVEGKYRVQNVFLYRMGDVDLSGNFAKEDDYAALEALLEDMPEDGAALCAADLDNDGKVDETDLQLMESITTQEELDAVLDVYYVPTFTYDYLGGDEVMPISGYFGPTRRGDTMYDFLTDDVFKLVKDSGVNMVNYVWRDWYESESDINDMLALAEKYGIGYYVNDARLNTAYDFANAAGVDDSTPLTESQVAGYLGDYSYYSSFLGTHVKDEPIPNSTYGTLFDSTRQLKYWKDIANTLNSYANTSGYINMVPEDSTVFSYCSTSYTKFWDDYIEATDPKVLSVDDYPFNDSSSEDVTNAGGYFTTLSVIREKAIDKNLPFWCNVQAGGDFMQDEDTDEALIATEEETYWNVNTSLAFGAKGISWFTLVQPYYFAEDSSTDSGKNYDKNGLISAEGKATTYYTYAKNANAQIAAVDEVLMKAESSAIMADGEYAEREVAEGLAQVDEALASVSPKGFLTGVSAESNNSYGVLVGCFNYRTTECYYVVNYDTTAGDTQTVTLTMNGECNYTLIQNAVSSDAAATLSDDGNYVIELTIPSGEAALIVLDEGTTVNVDAQYDWRNCGSNTTAYFSTTADDPLAYSADWTIKYTCDEGGVFVNGTLDEDAKITKITSRLYAIEGIAAAAGDVVTLNGKITTTDCKVAFSGFSLIRNADLSYSQYDETAPAIEATTVQMEDVYVDLSDGVYEIAKTPLVNNANVNVWVDDKTYEADTLSGVGEYTVKTVYETTYFSEIISSVGDITYYQNVILYQFGDTDKDGSSTSIDLVRTKKIEARLAVDVTAADKEGADLNMDGEITDVDATLMRRILSEKTTTEKLKEIYDTEVNFGVVSDLHYASDNSDGQRRLNTRKALNYYKSQAVDMIIFNADIADLGQTAEYKKLVADITAVFPDAKTRPKLIFTADNHEYYDAWSHNKTATATFAELQERFQTQLTDVSDNSNGMNSHYAIDGYHFISISADGMNESTQASYSETTLEFLNNALAEATSEDATKPIFVNVHQAPANTVIGSDKAGGCSPYLNSILEQYSQAIVFTSHTHASIAEEDSLWQDAYAVMNTGSLYYESGKGNTSYPIEEADQFAQGLMVRVKDGIVDVERCDFYNNAVIGDNWVLGNKS